jgi:molybdenum cofactor cytidylyltransferase
MVVLSPAQAARGMGSSIAAGVAASSDAPGWLIVPGDMPLLQSSTLRSVAVKLMQDPIVFAQYKGQRGHPVGFSSELYSELMSLEGDEGARRLLARFAAEPVVVNDPGVLVDVDTEADLARAQARDSGYDTLP